MESSLAAESARVGILGEQLTAKEEELASVALACANDRVSCERVEGERTSLAADLEAARRRERDLAQELEGVRGKLLTAEAVRSQMVVSIDYPVAETEKQKVIPVEVVSMPTPEKVPVEVLSMPGRETETVIKRDGDGNIVSTSQIERDV